MAKQVILTGLQKEFDRQIQNLVHQGYSKFGTMKEETFLKLVGQLREKAKELDVPNADLASGRLPFVIVVKKDIMPIATAMERVDYNDSPGIVDLFPKKPNEFKVIPTVTIPSSSLYLLVDIDRGKETINIRPNDALVSIEKLKRSPLSLEEGVALLTHFPEFLQTNNCFSLLASRCGDQRVPAIWISDKKARLGWCWAGNPHTWLGSASCSARIGV